MHVLQRHIDTIALALAKSNVVDGACARKVIAVSDGKIPVHQQAARESCGLLLVDTKANSAQLPTS